MKTYKAYLLLLFTLFCSFSIAAETATPTENTDLSDQSVLENSDDMVRNTRNRRASHDYFLLANYSPIDLLIPNKYGISAGLVIDADRSWELEYLRGTISVPFVVDDLGKMSDVRLSLLKRSYFGGNSFNLSYGVTYFDFSIHLGSEFLNQVNSNAPSIDLVSAEALGFNLAIGNRWTFDHNITVGVDWISWSQPVTVLNKKSAYLDSSASEESKDDVNTALNVISYFPRFSFLKLQVGILF